MCGVCGRNGKDRYNLGDTSCVSWAVLVKEESIERNENGKIVKARAWEEGT